MEKWGFREAARHLGCSWRFVQKEADGGVLAHLVLPEDEWAREQYVAYRRHYEKTPLGRWVHTHTTEEMSVYDVDEPERGIKAGDPKLVDKMFAADAIRVILPHEFQIMLRRRDEEAI